MSSNNPKVLIEFDPKEISYLADVLHDEFWRNVARKAMPGADTEKLDAKQKMQNVLRNRILDKAEDQGFGNL